MSDAKRDLNERVAARRATRRPVVVAIGATGGTQALRSGTAIAARCRTDVVVTSVVEPPPLYTFETNRAMLLPWIVEQQIGERRETVYDRLHRAGVLPPATSEPRVEVRYGDSGDTIAYRDIIIVQQPQNGSVTQSCAGNCLPPDYQPNSGFIGFPLVTQLFGVGCADRFVS